MSIGKKENGTWYVQYRIPGVNSPKREYTGTGPTGEALARQRDAEIRKIKTHGGQPTKPKHIYLDELAQTYLAERKMCNVSESWLKEMQSLLNNKVLPALCHVPVNELAYSDIVNLVEKEWGNLSLATKQRYLAYLKAIFNFGLLHELTQKNPLAKWKTQKEPRYDMRLTLPDLRLLLANAAPHFVWALEVEWELGARPGPSELFKIKWTDVNFTDGTIRVRGTKTHESDRVLPITERFKLRLLEKRKEAQSEYVIEFRGKPVNSLKTALAGAKKRAGLKYRIRLYDVRHLFASTMLSSGADLAAVSRLLGHADITTTQKYYYHLMAGEMARATNTRPTLQPDEI